MIYLLFLTHHLKLVYFVDFVFQSPMLKLPLIGFGILGTHLPSKLVFLLRDGENLILTITNSAISFGVFLLPHLHIFGKISYLIGKLRGCLLTLTDLQLVVLIERHFCVQLHFFSLQHFDVLTFAPV